MTATVLAIDGRNRELAAGMVAPKDFVFHSSGTIDAKCVVKDPTLSLYCLDTQGRSALFVRTPAHIDLSQAPFLYQTQHREATELVSVPFDELFELAAGAAVPPERLVFVQSTGRCGSTLVSRALAAGDDVVSLSEPDVYYQLHLLRDAHDPDFGALVKACTTLLCASRPAATWTIKFRSMAIELAQPLVRAFPGAKTVFLYRQADSWARSASRAFDLFLPDVLDRWGEGQILAACAIDRRRAWRRALPSPIEFLSWVWSTSMAGAMALQQAGLPMFLARYEELYQQPLEVLAALLGYCGISFNEEALAKVIARDSQEGTELSRDRAIKSNSELTEARRLAFRRCLAEVRPKVDPDAVLPGTFGTGA